MMEFDRVKAQRRADVSGNLLRGIETERGRLNSKIRLLQGEIDGAQQVIAQKNRQIEEALRQATELGEKLAYLDSQASELASDQTHWRNQLAV